MLQKAINYRISPEYSLNETKQTRIEASYFSAVSREQQCLLIGFDTEYQTTEGETDNQVISYQFSAEILDADPDCQLQSWSGIILPKSLALGDRLSFRDFLSIVVSEAIERFPDILIPKNIYLFAHMSRADVPAFAEFKDHEARRTLGLDNIRNTFVNVNRNLRCDIYDTVTDEPIEIKLLIRDTMHLAAGGKSLAEVGDLLGIEKVKLADSVDGELEVKKNMLCLFETDWGLFRRYALIDAIITHKYAVRILRLYQQLTGKFKFPLTLTAIGVDLLTKKWLDDVSNPALKVFLRDNAWDPLSLVGREEHKEPYWDKKRGRNGVRRTTPLIKKLFWHESIYTDGYHGGRNEQFWFGPLPESVWYDYDLTSAYPSVMTLIGYPDWEKIRLIEDTKELLSLRHIDFAVANVDFDFPESVRFPCLPVRTEGGLIFPRSGNTTTHVSEILVAKALGAKIEMVEGRIVPSRSYGDMVGHRIRPFLAFIQECVDTRRQYPKGTLENAFWKEMVNSTYGKTAQGLQKRRVYDLREETTKDLRQSKITNPIYASMISGVCRATLAEIMNALPDDVLVCSVTTDGFLTTATPAQMDAATSTFIKGYPWEDDDYDFEQFPPNSCIGYYREAAKLLQGGVPYLGGGEPIYEVKHVCRQPLGWRTRGQATLKPATEPDLKSIGLKKDDERFVLAKAGLQVGVGSTKPEQNTEIVRLFLERNPDTVIKQSRLYGIGDMYERGYDLAPYNITVSASMEYDWKRRPTSAIDVALPEHGCKHLQFQTVPWDDIVQYNTMRTNWRAYRKKERKCLKTKAELLAYNSYNSSVRSLEQSDAGRYLRHEGGDLKRLRQQIVIARELRRAGTHVLKPRAFGNTKIFPGKAKLTSQELTDFLIEVGVTCRKYDIDNDRRKARKVGFIPKQVPRNEATETILRTLKQEVFPELKIDDFLTEEVVDFYLEGRMQKETSKLEDRYHRIGRQLVREAIAAYKKEHASRFRNYQEQKRKGLNPPKPDIAGWSEDEIASMIDDGQYVQILQELPKHTDMTEEDIWAMASSG